MHPFLVLDGEVERSRPELVVRVFGLEHGLQQGELGLVEVQQSFLAVDGLDIEPSGVQVVSHSLQHFDVVTHLLRACYLPAKHATTKSVVILLPNYNRFTPDIALVAFVL